MYEFHYKYIGTKHDICAKLLFTGTDSLAYEIETNDVYKDFYEKKICLILAIIQKAQNCLILPIKK